MAETSNETGRGPAHQHVELGVAVVTGLFGIVTMYGSYLVGIKWGVSGPGAGFFPFYVGLIILGCSVFNFAQAFLAKNDGELFADYGQLRSVMSVVIPTAIYVAVIPPVAFRIPFASIAVPGLGLYVASMLLIAWFMKRLGHYGWGLTLAIAVGLPVITYVVFERWFLIPLPKGPIEHWLGL